VTTTLRVCEDGALRGRVYCQFCGVPMIITAIPFDISEKPQVTEWPCASCQQMNTADLGANAVGVAHDAKLPWE